MTYGAHLKNQKAARRKTPQSEPIPGKNQTLNAAGGYSYELDDWKRLRRFLILGCEGGGYYESEKQLTLDNVSALKSCLNQDYKRAIDMIVEVSHNNLAPKNDPAVFALAYATHEGTPASKKYANEQIQKVCRIGTHIFQFVQARQDLGASWGRAHRKALGKWYLDRPISSLINQALKYPQRNGVSHGDLLRLSHVKADEQRRQVFGAILQPEGGHELRRAKPGETPVVRSYTHGWEALRSYPLVDGYLKIKTVQDVSEAAKIIAAHDLPRELVPTQFLTDPKIWEAMLPHMGLTAMIRNLGNMSKCGLLTPLSDTARFISKQVENVALIRASRVHPWAVLLAARVYGLGESIKGDGTWSVVQSVVNSLEKAYELAFPNVEPTGKRFVLGLDVSGSMTCKLLGSPMSACEAAAALSMVTARCENDSHIMGFATDFRDLGITAKDSLNTVMKKAQINNFGGTDTSVAIRWAQDRQIPVDMFVIYTDGMTWAGNIHTCQALQEYRRRMGVPSKLAVVNFVAAKTSIADPKDPGSLDFVGFDASLPQALSAFATE